MSRPIPTTPCYRVLIPGAHPPTCNQLFRAKLRHRMRLSKQWSTIVAIACNAAEVPAATCKRRVSIEITLGPRRRGADADAFFKAVLDALVSCSRLVDDSPKWVEITTPTFARGAEDATAIVLEDVPS
jgi:Holliday junction resolvase RusA-like endonuclease